MKQKIWFFIALFLIAVNAVMMVKFFMNKRHHMRGDFGRGHGPHMQEGRRDHRGGPHGRHHFYMSRMLADSLGFSDMQKQSLQTINAALDLKKDSLINESEKTKELLSEEIYSETPNKSKIDSLIRKVSLEMEMFNRMRVQNAELVRNMCNPEQKKKLAQLMNNFRNEMNRHRDKH